MSKKAEKALKELSKIAFEEEGVKLSADPASFGLKALYLIQHLSKRIQALEGRLDALEAKFKNVRACPKCGSFEVENASTDYDVCLQCGRYF